MDFIKILLDNSELKEAKLFKAAAKAKANPEIGVVINNKAAFHVIKDCADVTIKYLPLYVFGSYQDPLNELKGKFTKKQIEEFIVESEKELWLKQLLILIIEKIKNCTGKNIENGENSKNELVENLSDPYGDYGHEFINKKEDSDNNVLLSLCEAFGATE